MGKGVIKVDLAELFPKVDLAPPFPKVDKIEIKSLIYNICTIQRKPKCSV